MNNILQVLGIAVAIAVGVWSVQEKAQEKAQEKPAETPATATNTTPVATPASASSATAPLNTEHPLNSSPQLLPAANQALAYDRAPSHAHPAPRTAHLA